MASTPTPALIDRADIHKSCKALEALASVLAAYTDTANSLANIQRKLSKALKEAASVKGTYDVPSNALTVIAGVFEALSEVDTKFVKIADKESETIGNDLRKWFKKLAKEEKAHDERMTTGNAKIKQAGQTYERKAKRKDRDVAEEHSRYVDILNTVGPEMAQDRYNHSLFVTGRHTVVLSDLAGSLARLAEIEWGRACEHVRRCAPFIGDLGQCRALCEGGWSGALPGDLPDLDDKLDNEPEKKQTTLFDRPVAHTPPIPTGTSSPVTTSARSKPPSYTPSLNGAPSGIDILNPPPISPISNLKTTPKVSNEDLTSTQQTQEVQAPSRDNLSNQPALQRTVDSDVESPIQKRVSVGTPKLNVADLNMPETAGNHSLSPHDSSPVSIGQHTSLDMGEQQPINHAEVAQMPKGRPRYVDPPESKTLPNNAPETHVLDRRISVESNTNGGSLVANMRERYDTRPRPTNPPSSPPPRDLPRTTQRVLDLATRYTPLDAPLPPSRSDGSLSAQTGLAGDRFTTFQERYSHNNNNVRVKERDPPERSKRDYSDEREEPRSQYNTLVPVQSRNQYLRDDRDEREDSRSQYNTPAPPQSRNQYLRNDRDSDQYHSTRPTQRTPDRQYVDEVGMHSDRRRFDPIEEMTLQERELNLREQERRLEIERARLANARDGGYTSDSARSHGGNSPYGRRISESPTRMSSQQLLLPPQSIPPDDHSPSCGCQRCSAQHYASPTSGRTHRDSAASLAPVYKPDPPIQLRPEKPKGWLRRMSMPVASIVSSNENKSPSLPSVSNPQRSYMDLPTEDGRIRRRSFESEQVHANGRYTSTERRR